MQTQKMSKFLENLKKWAESLDIPIKMHRRQYNTKGQQKLHPLHLDLQYIKYISLILHGLK